MTTDTKQIDTTQSNMSIAKENTTVSDSTINIDDVTGRDKLVFGDEIQGDKNQKNIVVERDVIGSVLITGDNNQVFVSSSEFYGPTHNLYSINQLRRPVQHFIGRENILADLLEQLSQKNKGAICGLEGMGGVGKTELANLIAWQLKDVYPDGQLFVPLNTHNSSTLSVADAMNYVIHSFLPKAELPDNFNELRNLYWQVLQNKRVILILDDARDDKHIEPLLPPASCSLIVTSRYRLETIKQYFVDLLSDEQSVKLVTSLCDRLSESESRLIANQCENLPIALTIIAGLLNSRRALSVHDYLHSLKKSGIEQIQSEGRGMSLSAIFESSYALLAAPQKYVFRILSVIPKDFNRDTALAVSDGNTVDANSKYTDIASILDFLVSSNLIIFQPETSRFHLHDLTRDFAFRKLQEYPDEWQQAILRHTRHFINVGLEIEQLFEHGAEHKALQLFDQERIQFETAFQNLTIKLQRPDSAHSEYAQLLTKIISIIIFPLQELRFHPSQSIDWLEVLLKACRLIGDKLNESKALGYLGIAYNNLGEYSKAIDYFTNSLILAQEINEYKTQSDALNNIGTAYKNLGEFAISLDFHEKSFNIYQQIDNHWGKARSLNYIGIAHKNLRNFDKAIESYEYCLKIARENHNRIDESLALGNLGIVYYHLGEYSRSLNFHQQRLNMARTLGDQRGEGNALGGLADSYLRLGELTTAKDLYDQQIIIANRIGNRLSVANASAGLSEIYEHLEDLSMTIQHMAQAVEIAKHIKAPKLNSWKQKLDLLVAAQLINVGIKA